MDKIADIKSTVLIIFLACLKSCSVIFKNKFIYLYLFLAVLSLHCCTQAFSSCSERGLLFIAVRGPLTAVASFVAEHGL